MTSRRVFLAVRAMALSGLLVVLVLGCFSGCATSPHNDYAVDEHLVEAFSMSQDDAVKLLNLKDSMKVETGTNHPELVRYTKQYIWCGHAIDSILSFNQGKPMHFHGEDKISLNDQPEKRINEIIDQYSGQFEVFRNAYVSQNNKDILSAGDYVDGMIADYVDKFLNCSGTVSMAFRYQVPGTEMKDLRYAECLFDKADGVESVAVTLQLLCYAGGYDQGDIEQNQENPSSGWLK